MAEVDVMIDAEEEDEPEVPDSADDSQEQDDANIYLHQVGRIPLLTPEEEARLFQKIKAARTAGGSSDEAQQARLRVIEGNLRLVAKIAIRYQNLGLPFLDLAQEGNIGLMKAVEKFEPEKGFRFTTYASWWIQQGMMRALTDTGRTIRLPAHMIERLGRLKKGRERLQKIGNAQPTVEETAKEAEEPVEKAKQAFKVAQSPTSLDAPLREEEEKHLMDLVQDENASSPEDEVTQNELVEALEKVLGMLRPREAEVVRLRFGLGDEKAHSLEQVGRIFGVTRERIRQIEGKALTKLRHPVRSEQLQGFLGGV